MKVCIIDYGLGNVQSIFNMLKTIDRSILVEISADPEKIHASNMAILPGVGAFSTAVMHMQKSELASVLKEKLVDYDFRLLGICLGMQLLGQSSEEGSGLGLNLISAKIKSLSTVNASITVPHMGWANVEDKLNVDLGSRQRFYFTHSYYMETSDSSDIWMTTRLAKKEVTVAVKKRNVFGVQFHPEKSHEYGKAFFSEFVKDAI